jgi:hypothetical protein
MWPNWSIRHSNEGNPLFESDDCTSGFFKGQGRQVLFFLLLPNELVRLALEVLYRQLKYLDL